VRPSSVLGGPEAGGSTSGRVAGARQRGVGLVGNPVTTLARPRVSGKFLDPSVKYGQKATHVTIAPPADVRATLQRWDGKAWRDVKWVQLTGGAGNYTFTATQPGRVTYRFLVPAFTYAGRPLSWQVSPNFVLTTSWSSGATVE